MARFDDKRKAIEMRLQGKTYTDIKNTLHISKSTLCSWLHGYELTAEQMVKLEMNKNRKREASVEKIRETKRLKRDQNIRKIYEEEKSKWGNLTQKELLLCGLFLYWGEGTKGWDKGVTVCNTDPIMMKFFLLWMTKGLKIEKARIKVSLHLYKNMNIADSIRHWSLILKIPESQFIRPYIKNSDSKSVDHPGYHMGTCSLYVYNVEIKRKILAGIKAVADSFFAENNKN